MLKTNFDIHNLFHNVHLYAIEKPNQKRSYLYGCIHFRLAPFKLPDGLINLLPSVEHLVTEADYEHDEELKSYRASGASIWLRLYDAHPPLFSFAKRFFDVIRLYEKSSESHFIYPNFPWLYLAFEKEVIYTERMLYQLLPNATRSGLESFKQIRTLHGTDMKTIEEDIQITLQSMLFFYQNGLLKQPDLAIYEPEADHSKINLNFKQLVAQQKVSERNKLWMEEIPNILGEKTALFAVGSAHLVELLPSLMKMGYTLLRMNEGQEWEEVTQENYLLPFTK